ncbi:hypothetical protein ACET3Z_011638 [Daucus carota]
MYTAHTQIFSSVLHLLLRGLLSLWKSFAVLRVQITSYICKRLEKVGDIFEEIILKEKSFKRIQKHSAIE